MSTQSVHAEIRKMLLVLIKEILMGQFPKICFDEEI